MRQFSIAGSQSFRDAAEFGGKHKMHAAERIRRAEGKAKKRDAARKRAEVRKHLGIDGVCK